MIKNCCLTLVGPTESILALHVAAWAMQTELNSKLPTFLETEANQLKLLMGAAMLVSSR